MDCARLENDGRVPFPKDLPDGQTRDHPLGGRFPCQPPDMTNALKVHAFNRRGTHRVSYALLQIRRSTNTCTTRGGPAYGNVRRILEKAKYGLEIPQTHRSTDTRICRKLHANRSAPRTVQINRRVRDYLKQSRHWAAFGNAPWYDYQPKGSMEEPSLGSTQQRTRLSIRAHRQIVFHQMGPLVTARRKQWCGKCHH